MPEDLNKTPPPKEYTEEYFLTCCGGFREYLQGEIPLRHQKALEYLEVCPGDIILDIGCGRGEMLRACISRGAEAIGIDYSSAAVRISSSWNCDSAVVRASATALPFGSENFDKVIMLDIVEHLAPNDLLECLKDVGRVLKKDGQVLIHTPNLWGERLSSLLLSLASRFRLCPGKRNSNLQECSYGELHVNVQSPISLKRALHQAGLKGKIWFAKDPLQEVPWWWAAVDRLLFFVTTIWCRAYKG